MNKRYFCLLWRTLPVIFVFFIFFSGCKSSKPVEEIQGLSEGKKWDANNNGILFLTILFKGGDHSIPVGAELAQCIIRDGKIKESTNLIKPPQAGDVYINVYSGDSIMVSTHLIKNPLIQHVEFSDEEGFLTTKEIRLPEKEHFIRFNLEKKVNNVKIISSDPNHDKGECVFLIIDLDHCLYLKG
ncbi:MAG TPA: hypothetical protein PKC30_10120 [Saprospiraceae bacterium]|nr:hypothetical protein [Saprospiraceae bacterium]